MGKQRHDIGHRKRQHAEKDTKPDNPATLARRLVRTGKAPRLILDDRETRALYYGFNK